MTSTETVAEQEAPAARPRRRVLRRLTNTVLLLALLLGAAFFGGGGWYFAGQIHDDGLAVRTADAAEDLVLSLRDDGRVEIRSDDAGDLAVLRDDATYGLTWDGGYGQVTGPSRRDLEDGVVRDFAVLDGKPPVAGTRAHLDRPAFPEDAAALPGEVREVRYAGRLGRTDAWFAPAEGGNGRTWAVLVHGKGGTRAEMVRMLRTTVAAGLPSLAIEYRNDPGAPDDPSGLHQFGRTEWADLASAVDHARQRGARKVVLVGASMGGGIIAAYLRQVPDAPVAGLVLDSPMLDFGQTVSYGAAQRPLPLFGTVPEPLTWTAKQIAAWRWDVDWARMDYLNDTTWLEVPTLVFHGDADTTVPLATSEQLQEAHPELVRLEVVPDAQHVEAWNQAPEAYDAALAGFLRRL